MLKNHKLPMSLGHVGNWPSSLLFARYRYRRLERVPSSDGIVPLSLLFARSSCRRSERSPSSAGIEPVSSLWPSSRYWRLERVPSSDGIDPLSLLPERNIRWRLSMSPSSDGIDPLSLFCRRRSTWRLSMSPSLAGIDPSRPVSSRLILVTRLGVVVATDGSGYTVIPGQFDTAVVPSQFKVELPWRMCLASKSASQSATSWVCTVGSGTVTPFRHSVNGPIGGGGGGGGGVGVAVGGGGGPGGGPSSTARFVTSQFFPVPPTVLVILSSQFTSVVRENAPYTSTLMSYGDSVWAPWRAQISLPTGAVQTT